MDFKISNSYSSLFVTCDGGDPCVDVDVPKLIDAFIAKFAQRAPGINSDNVTFSIFYQFQNW
jgi:hypothetical protein